MQGALKAITDSQLKVEVNDVIQYKQENGIKIPFFEISLFDRDHLVQYLKKSLSEVKRLDIEIRNHFNNRKSIPRLTINQNDPNLIEQLEFYLNRVISLGIKEGPSKWFFEDSAKIDELNIEHLPETNKQKMDVNFGSAFIKVAQSAVVIPFEYYSHAINEINRGSIFLLVNVSKKDNGQFKITTKSKVNTSLTSEVDCSFEDIQKLDKTLRETYDSYMPPLSSFDRNSNEFVSFISYYMQLCMNDFKLLDSNLLKFCQIHPTLASLILQLDIEKYFRSIEIQIVDVELIDFGRESSIFIKVYKNMHLYESMTKVIDIAFYRLVCLRILQAWGLCFDQTERKSLDISEEPTESQIRNSLEIIFSKEEVLSSYEILTIFGIDSILLSNNKMLPEEILEVFNEIEKIA